MKSTEIDMKNRLTHVMYEGRMLYGVYVTVASREGWPIAKTILSDKPLSDDEIGAALDRMAALNARRLAEEFPTRSTRPVRRSTEQ